MLMTDRGAPHDADVPRKMMEAKAGAGVDDAELLQQQFKEALLAKRAAKSGASAVAVPAVKQVAEKAMFPTTGNTIHTLCTSNGSPYMNFQNRIMCVLLLGFQHSLGLISLSQTRARFKSPNGHI